MFRHAFVPFLLLTTLSLFGAENPELDRAAARITATSAYATVETLSSPAFCGRLSGSEGYQKTVDWMVTRVRETGLKTLSGVGDYRQAFTHGTAGVESTSLTLFPAEGETDGKPTEMELFKDFVPMANGGSGDLTADVVFVGYGLHAPDQRRDDYAGVDVKGKIVMSLRGEPEKGEWKDHRSSQARTNAAANLGASALLIVDSPVLSTNDRINHELPAALVSEAFADRLLAGLKITVADLKKVLSKGGTASFPVGRRVHLAIKTKPHHEVTTQNVVAVLPGVDPSVRGEYVVVGAHLDHVGDWPKLNPGADDNASGSAALLEIARASAKMKAKPRRTIVLVWFAAEEAGLLGAEHFAKNPPAGLGKCVAVLNLDMVGVGTGLWVAGGENFPEIQAALEKARDRFAPELTLKAGKIRGEGRADHAPFFERGVHAVSLFSMGGEHHGYHSPNDTLWWITPKTMEAVARTALGSAWALADAR